MDLDADSLMEGEVPLEPKVDSAMSEEQRDQAQTVDPDPDA